MEKKQKESGLGIGAKSFVTAIVVIFALMVLTYSLTFIVPGGCWSLERMVGRKSLHD